LVSRPPKPPKTPELAEAEADALRAIAGRRYDDASRVVALYESRQSVPRGIGVDWSNPDVEGDVVALHSILDGPGDPSHVIRVAAAMMYLWGVSKPYRRWLSREENGDAAATELVLRAYKARQAAATQRAKDRGWL
jgi:hypothetical protein